jgi:ribosomal protein S18 acetylase RimI-like enzyme
MANLHIRPITDEEFTSWRAASLDSYGKEKAREGLSENDARAEAEASFQRHLGKGKDSPNHHVYAITREGSTIGTLWWGVQKHGTQEVAWIYDIVLDPAYRGKGLGRRTMEWAMRDAKAKGFAKLGLHVFGHNQTARKLYESLGFEATNIVMYRKI